MPKPSDLPPGEHTRARRRLGWHGVKARLTRPPKHRRTDTRRVPANRRIGMFLQARSDCGFVSWWVPCYNLARPSALVPVTSAGNRKLPPPTTTHGCSSSRQTPLLPGVQFCSRTATNTRDVLTPYRDYSLPLSARLGAGPGRSLPYILMETQQMKHLMTQSLMHW